MLSQTNIDKLYNELEALKKNWLESMATFINSQSFENTAGIVWDKLTESFQNYLNKCQMLMLEVSYEAFNQHLELSKKSDKFEWPYDYLLNYKYATDGLIALLKGQYTEAINYLKKAIATNKHILITHLWLLDAYYRAGKYHKIERHYSKHTFNKLSNEYKNNNAIYPYFSLLGEEVILENYLQLMHVYLVIPEFNFYLALAKQHQSEHKPKRQKAGAISETTALHIRAKMYADRGYLCLLNFNLKQAIFNFDNYLKVDSNNSWINFLKSVAMIFLGEHEIVFRDIIPRILKANDDKCFAEYMFFYLNVCWILGDESTSEELFDKIKDIEAISDKHRFELLHWELLFQTFKKNPHQQRIKNKLEQLFILFHKIDYSVKETNRLLNKLVHIIQKFIINYSNINNIEMIIWLFKFASRLFKTIFDDLEKNYKKIAANSRPYFPNAQFARLYLQVCIESIRLDIIFNVILAETKEKITCLLSIKEIIDNIPNALENYSFPEANNLAGLSLANLKEVYEIYCLDEKNSWSENDLDVRELEKIEVLENTEFFDDDIKKILTKDFFEEAEEIIQQYFSITSVLPILNIFQYIESSISFYKIATRIITAVRLEVIFIKFLETCSNLEHNPTSFIEICKLLNQQLEEYKKYTESRINKFYKYALEKSYHDFLYQSIQKMLVIALFAVEHLLKNQEFNKITIVLEMFSPLIQKLIDVKDDRFIISFRNIQLSLERPAIVSQFENIKNQLLIREIELKKEQIASIKKNDPLCLEYGKNVDTTLIPFPFQLLVSSLDNYQKKHGIRSTANLSAHGLTIVFSKEKHNKQSQNHEKTILFLPFAAYSDDDKPQGYNIIPGNDSEKRAKILRRIQTGWDVHNAFKTQHHLFDATTMCPKEFVDVKHKHSEQHYYHFLDNINFEQMLEQIQQLPTGKNFQPGHKVYAVINDMASIRTSCQCCRLSTLSWQKSPEGFVKRFQDFLESKGFLIPGKPQKNNHFIKSATRILADEENKCDGYDKIKPHQNPETINIKYLENIGIFQIKKPLTKIFVSGSINNVFSIK